MISKRSFGGKCFFANSGSEANEAAIKLARRATAEGKYKIITMEKSFHGRTYGAMSATAQAKIHMGHEPLVPGFVYVPFGDIDAVRKAVDAETAGIMVEPIQGEGGVRMPPPGYLAGLRELCDANKMVLIFDEVQTGLGRQVVRLPAVGRRAGRHDARQEPGWRRPHGRDGRQARGRRDDDPRLAREHLRRQRADRRGRHRRHRGHRA
jgi:hypothetical protein